MKVLVYLLIFICIVWIYSVIENRFIKTAHYFVRIKHNGDIVADVSGLPVSQHNASDNIHVVQLSDLHNCRYGKNNQRLLERIEACKPDLILLTGDMINKYREVHEEFYIFCEKLSILCPCVYSFGNHELIEREKYPQRFSEYSEKLKRCGIILSDNEACSLTVRNTSLKIGSYSSNIDQYKKCNRKQDISAYDKVIDTEINRDEVGILLSHDPELDGVFTEASYQVIFSGHLHGGIVRIPGGRGIISTRFELFPGYDGGCYRLDNSHVLIVSRGLGSHTIKFRLFNRPEIVHAVIMTEDNRKNGECYGQHDIG